ncbi:MAG: DNA replication/repair protein RecF [Nevskia sp.]|nr:DNA replication/repair protein RecF [Nevskia sp.]
MRFRRARAQHFRLFQAFDFEPHSRLNFVTGANAAGKTSLLEALYVSARGDSHRGAISTLASDGQSSFLIDSRISSVDGRPDDKVEVRWQDRRIGVRINDQAAGLSDLVRRMPVLLIDPLAHRLIEEGPGIRRRFIDWGVFHMEQEFHDQWRRFNRALRQRNAALRAQASVREIESWSPELAATADLLTAMRVRYLDRLSEIAPVYWQSLVNERGWSLDFVRGWRDGESYADTLIRTLDGDRNAGHTREGPHRAELRVLSDNSLLKERVSRGQQKLLIAGLILAQGELYRQRHDDAPVLLLDDFAAELSMDSQQRLMTQLQAWPGQSVITALDYSPLLQATNDHVMFHVEHGEITLKKTI